jgi:hypothetical protein
MSNHIYTSDSPPKQSDKFEFLNLRLLPGKVDYRQAGYILDFEPVSPKTRLNLAPIGSGPGLSQSAF